MLLVSQNDLANFVSMLATAFPDLKSLKTTIIFT